jgi:hypothetical protein
VAGTIGGAIAQSAEAPRAAVAQVSAPTPTVANVATPALTPEEQQMLSRRFSPERLAVVRARLQGDAQRAVRDDAEQGYREPTAEEAAALASRSANASGSEVVLANGAVARRSELANVEFLKATAGDGGVTLSHDQKGARRDQ